MIIRVSKYIFFTYLFHVFVIQTLTDAWMSHSLSFNPIFSIPLLSLCVFLIYMLTAGIIDHIPVVRKLLG